MKYNVVIWDFNGTVCNDVQLGIECINTVLARRNMKIIPDIDTYRKLFCFPIIDYYRKLGFDFSKEPYETPAVEWNAEYLKNEHKIKKSDGIVEVLEAVKKKKIKQVILSASEITMLRRELDILGLTEYFDEVLGTDDTFGGGKIKLAENWAKRKNTRAVLIGDSVHDCDTASAIGADCILFTGGHDSKEHLLSCNVPTVDKICDVIPLIFNNM